MPKRLIIAILTAVGVLAFGFFLVWPKFQSFQQLQSELIQKKASFESKSNYYSKIRETWERLEKYQDSLSKIETAVSESYSLPVIFNYLQEVSGQSGLVIKNLMFVGVNGQEIREITLNLELAGSYPSLKSFLEALENSARVFNVKSINFSSPKDGKIFSFNLIVSTYSY